MGSCSGERKWRKGFLGCWCDGDGDRGALCGSRSIARKTSALTRTGSIPREAGGPSQNPQGSSYSFLALAFEAIKPLPILCYLGAKAFYPLPSFLLLGGIQFLLGRFRVVVDGPRE